MNQEEINWEGNEGEQLNYVASGCNYWFSNITLMIINRSLYQLLVHATKAQ